MLLLCYYYCHSYIINVWQTYFVNGMAVLLLLGVYTVLNVIVILFIVEHTSLLFSYYCHYYFVIIRLIYCTLYHFYIVYY